MKKHFLSILSILFVLSVSGCNKEAKEEKKQFDILTQDILDLLDDSFKLETAMLYQGVIYREVLYMTPTRIHSADIINEEESLGYYFEKRNEDAVMVSLSSSNEIYEDVVSKWSEIKNPFTDLQMVDFKRNEQGWYELESDYWQKIGFQLYSYAGWEYYDIQFRVLNNQIYEMKLGFTDGNEESNMLARFSNFNDVTIELPKPLEMTPETQKLDTAMKKIGSNYTLEFETSRGNYNFYFNDKGIHFKDEGYTNVSQDGKIYWYSHNLETDQYYFNETIKSSLDQYDLNIFSTLSGVFFTPLGNGIYTTTHPLALSDISYYLLYHLSVISIASVQFFMDEDVLTSIQIIATIQYIEDGVISEIETNFKIQIKDVGTTTYFIEVPNK